VLKKIALRLAVITLLIVAYAITGTFDYQDSHPEVQITLTGGK